MTPTLDFALLDRYLAGECTPQEQTVVAAWLASHASAAELVDTLRRLDRDPAAVLQAHADVDADDARIAALRVALRQRLLGAVRGHSGRTPTSMSRVAQPSAFATRWLVAGMACLALVVALETLFWRTRSTGAVASHTYATAPGQIATYVLPDGSRMTLAPHTTAQVHRGFGDETRAVVLNGEAYFDVRSGNRAPFEVHTGSVTTRVLGTRFDVRRYDAEPSTHVAVEVGRVSVQEERHGRQPIVLSAGMIARMTDTTAVVTTGADSAVMGAWRDGTLVFVNAPVSDVLAAISHWYGYEFRGVDSTLLRSEISIHVSGSSPSNTMALLESALNVTLTFGGPQDRIVTVHSTPRHPLADEQSRRHPIRGQSQEVGR
jgi:ferric-dicitrate binding protein FerR (iron transport regulator)